MELRRRRSSPALHESLGLVRYQSHSHLLRRSSISPEPTSSVDAETHKYAGYAALLLFCGPATYYSFPLPDDAKHKKTQIFRYAPLPEDLHMVSNWSGTNEVQTRNFLQPENTEHLERAVREAHEKRTRTRLVSSGLSPTGSSEALAAGEERRRRRISMAGAEAAGGEGRDAEEGRKTK